MEKNIFVLRMNAMGTKFNGKEIYSWHGICSDVVNESNVLEYNENCKKIFAKNISEKEAIEILKRLKKILGIEGKINCPIFLRYLMFTMKIGDLVFIITDDGLTLVEIVGNYEKEIYETKKFKNATAHIYYLKHKVKILKENLEIHKDIESYIKTTYIMRKVSTDCIKNFKRCYKI